MGKLILPFILLVSSFAITAAAELAVRGGGGGGGGGHHRLSSRTRAFVESHCRDTHYPKVCAHLSNYINSTTENPQQLAQIALRVSLAKAQYARIYLIKVAKEFKQIKAKEYQATKDCLDQISDGVEQLKGAIKELQRIKEDDENDFVWRQSNVQTWTSAALTDALSCMDGFSGYAMRGKTKAIVKAKILNVAQVTSNALALFSRFVARHRASHATKP